MVACWSLGRSGVRAGWVFIHDAEVVLLWFVSRRSASAGWMFIHDAERLLLVFVSRRSASVRVGVLLHDAELVLPILISPTLRVVRVGVCSRRERRCYFFGISTLRRAGVGCLFTTRSVVLLYFVSRTLRRSVRVWMFVTRRERRCYSIDIATLRFVRLGVCSRRGSVRAILLYSTLRVVRVGLFVHDASVVLLCLYLDAPRIRAGWMFIHDAGKSCYIYFVSRRSAVVAGWMFVPRRGRLLLCCGNTTLNIKIRQWQA